MGCVRAMFFDRSLPFLVVVVVVVLVVLVLLLPSLLPCRRLSELTMPVHQTAVGKEAKKLTNVFEKRVLKEVQRYEHRIFQEMDPETAEQLQQSENEVRGSGGGVVVWWWCVVAHLCCVVFCSCVPIDSSVCCVPPPRPTKGRSVARHVVRVEKTNRFGKGNAGKDSERVSGKFWRQRGHQQRSQKW